MNRAAFQMIPEHTVRIEGNRKPVGSVRWAFPPMVARIEGNRSPERRTGQGGGVA